MLLQDAQGRVLHWTRVKEEAQESLKNAERELSQAEGAVIALRNLSGMEVEHERSN